jgi:hypothetical protein
MFVINNAPILCQGLHYIKKDQNKVPLVTRHHRVPSGASKTITEHMVCLAQTMHLSCTDTNTTPNTPKQDLP